MNALHALRADGGAADAMSQPSIRECVSRAVRRYLEDLDDHPVVDLHAQVLAEVEAPLLAEVMRHFDGNQTRAAAALGLNRATLRKKLRLYRIA